MAEECPGCGRKIAAEFKSKDAEGVDQVRIKCPECGYNKVVKNAPNVPCFVATAVFEDPLHPLVCRLRNFRDAELLSRRSGRAFASFYYRYGPYLARIVERMPWLKPSLRIVITGLVKLLPKT